MTEYPQDVMQRFHGTPAQMAGALVREPPNGWRTLAIEDYDPAWADRYATVAASLREVLGGLVIEVDHVGSTAVPGLPAKPIIDIDLSVADADDEASYLPRLEGAGYWLVLREPWWHGHRMLVDAAEDVHLHIWPHGAPETVRHRLFRDWLRTHPEDRDLYGSTKRRLAGEVSRADYTLAKSDVIDDIFSRVFAGGRR
ncbi:GrpB family protein [Actinoplanes sp. NPDC051861]|uniref:GrpB family protein n=1 Tax=Actinoplanes sp. NPDC051861 TaxID=3155170 RepID=UPI003430C733